MEKIKITFNDLMIRKPFMDKDDNICVIYEKKLYIVKMNDKGEIVLYAKEG